MTTEDITVDLLIRTLTKIKMIFSMHSVAAHSPAVYHERRPCLHSVFQQQMTERALGYSATLMRVALGCL